MIDFSLSYVSITSDGFVQVDCISEMVEIAKMRHMSEFKDEILSTTTFNPKNKFGSVLGEVVFGFICPQAVFVNNYDYDYLLNNNQYRNLKIDIKTKVRNVPPRLYFNGSIPKMQFERQRTDWYLFLSYLYENNNHTIWICGRLSKKMFKDRMLYLREGETDGTNNSKALADTYNVRYAHMKRWNRRN